MLRPLVDEVSVVGATDSDRLQSLSEFSRARSPGKTSSVR